MSNQPTTTPYDPDTSYDEFPTTSPCPECTAALCNWTRQKAWDAYWATGPLTEVRRVQRGMVHQRIVRNVTANRADPTSVDILACGHSVF